GIGALVPAAIMSIAAANLWTRNIYKEFFRRNATHAQEAKQAKLASLVVKFGALLFIVFVDPQYAIDLQTIGGVIILQTLPAMALKDLNLFGWHPFGASQVQIYVGVIALAANLIIAAIVTVILHQLKVHNGRDRTNPADYHADEGDPNLKEVAAAAAVH